VAVLDAAIELLARSDAAGTTVDALAAAAGVSKKTIYRWWPSKGAVWLEAMTRRADLAAPTPDTGSLHSDLHAFLTATFRAVSATGVAPALRAVMAEAQHDPPAAALMHEFTGARRAALGRVIARAADRGELDPAVDPDLLVDQAFGVLWYRLLTGHGVLDATAAAHLADGLTRQVSPPTR
jgi:AcrR family transcriptional regulator